VYYSIVTLTTLGYGDVVPASPAAQVLAMIEVILGYVMLGGLLSIFASKMARRAD
jgi:voltage-gated potassium channel Kch